MGYVKCPRCELNYMKDTDKYCDVCKRELLGSAADEEVELCSICGESPALPGKDVCLFCLREMNGKADASSVEEDIDEEEDDDDDDDVDDEDLEEIEDIDDIEDLDELDDMISLDEMADDEQEDDEEEDSEDI